LFIHKEPLAAGRSQRRSGVSFRHYFAALASFAALLAASFSAFLAAASAFFFAAASALIRAACWSHLFLVYDIS
jgi:hypothetical protein